MFKVSDGKWLSPRLVLHQSSCSIARSLVISWIKHRDHDEGNYECVFNLPAVTLCFRFCDGNRAC